MFNNIKTYFKTLGRPILQNKKHYFGYLAIRTIMSQEGIFITWLLAQAIIFLQKGNNHGFWIIVWVYIGTKILMKILNAMQNFGHLRSVNGLNFTLQEYFFTKYISLDNSKVELLGTGKTQDIITQGIYNRTNTLMLRTDVAGRIIAIIIARIIVAQQTSLLEFSSLLILFAGAIALIKTGFNVLLKTRRENREIKLETARLQIKIFMSKFEILQQNKIGQEIQNFRKLINKTIHIRTKGIAQKLKRETSGSLVIDATTIVALIVIGLGVLEQRYNIAYLVLIMGLLEKIAKFVREIRAFIKQYDRDIVAVEKLIETFDDIPSIDFNKGKNFIHKKGDIVFKNLCFGYEKEKIFNQFNLEIQGGKKTALVGHSGGGKTTIIKLIANYLRPQKGSITIDDQDLKKIKLLDYYQHVGYLSQEPSVFDGTIRENLEYSTPQLPSDDQIKNVLQLAKCEFVYDLSSGLDTEIGERGIRLSGGQKQRLAIAKIMLKNPEIILLDEPTSALDSIAEQKISEALHNLFQGKTVIVIAHRLQTVKEADDIIVLDKGTVAQRGSHHTLQRQKGIYKEMLDLQTTF